jgi:hypothetical protein
MVKEGLKGQHGEVMDDGIKICKERMGIIWLKAGIWK